MNSICLPSLSQILRRKNGASIHHSQNNLVHFKQFLSRKPVSCIFVTGDSVPSLNTEVGSRNSLTLKTLFNIQFWRKIFFSKWDESKKWFTIWSVSPHEIGFLKFTFCQGDPAGISLASLSLLSD